MNLCPYKLFMSVSDAFISDNHTITLKDDKIWLAYRSEFKFVVHEHMKHAFILNIDVGDYVEYVFVFNLSLMLKEFWEGEAYTLVPQGSCAI